MSFEIEWTDIALQDMEEYLQWIKKDSVIQAEKVACEIFDLANKIAINPYRGHIVPEIKVNNLRFKLIYGRRFIYEIREGSIVIKRIISCKMDFLPEYSRDDQSNF